MIRRLTYGWLIPFLPCLIVYVFIKHQTFETERLNKYVNSKFTIDNFLDIDGEETKLSLDQSHITIVDFWHKQCPPCIDEMSQFASLIRGKENLVSIFSVSINNYRIWRQLFKDQKAPFQFMGENLPNWKHAVLNSKQDPRLKNAIPGDNLSLLENEYHTNTFPAYFVLDNSGTIIATPSSAVNYIKANVFNKSTFLIFITDKTLWAASVVWLPRAFLLYTVCFWSVSLIVLVVSRRLSHKTNKHL